MWPVVLNNPPDNKYYSDEGALVVPQWGPIPGSGTAVRLVSKITVGTRQIAIISQSKNQ